ncbi:peptide chain release factor N(5)-glutamine methyltransferase [Roseospirillum parvum]|uniref:Release factor glutamine methyltransferase n=1 Tax=Roseospirillum parvum TaxID=83401 RepID=A0A1G7UU70_9PROT|nr:peptide chain release factor N(5)-glutamine methyltransferase [Roseospirillum parvum]SDG51155.1 release factor glutamine methyltransferase [Roseospirillum parvum]
MERADALTTLSRRFAKAGLGSPRLDARLLVAHAGGPGDGPLEAAAQQALEALAERRLSGEPVSRILGRRGFWTLELELSAATLDPRPDSETLIEAALAHLPGPRHAPYGVLDLGTGTGCLLLALLAELPNARGLGLDIDPEAVATARRNAARNHLADRARFKVGGWGDAPFPAALPPADLIVSNPPYIPAGEIAALAPEVARFDPLRALDGGADGLDAYRALLPLAAGHLATDGRLILEVGLGQADPVRALAEQMGWHHQETRPDLGGIPRALVFAHKPVQNGKKPSPA